MIKIAICDDDIHILKSIAKVAEAAIISTDFAAEVVSNSSTTQKFAVTAL